MRAPAGWYPDPQDRSRLRYWDGSGWSDRVLGAGAAGPQPSRRSSTVRVVGAVAGIALVLGVGIGLGLRTLAAGGTDAGPDPTVGTPTGTPTFPAEPIDIAFEEGETWSEPITVTELGVYRVVAEGDGTADLRLELRQGDAPVAVNDDGRSPLRGDSSLDPLLVVVLRPGDYEVVVGTYRDRSAGTGRLQVEPLTDAVPLTVDETVTVEVPADGAAVGYLSREDATSLVVDVRADGGPDLSMLVTGADGGMRVVEDRGGSAADAHGGERSDPLTSTTASDLVVVVWADDGSPSTGTVALTPG